MLIFLIYLLGVVDSIISVATMAIGVGVLFLVPTTFLACLGYDEEDKEVGKKLTKRLLYVIAVGTTVGVFTPASPTIAAMYLVPKLAESEQLQNISQEGLDVLELHLKSWKEDLVGQEISE